ncbi:MAG: outer membrane beta-barrel protein [Pseudomonadota bacterium]
MKPYFFTSKRNLLLKAAILLILSLCLTPNPAYACGHDGFYVGLGYEQLIPFSPDRQYSISGNGQRITFGTRFGGLVLIGYDFPCTRWGVQLTFDGGKLRLNKIENIYYLGSNLEGVVHLASWRDGLDIYLVGGAGTTYLTEGDLKNSSATFGINVGFGPGIAYYFKKSDRMSAALKFDIPLRYTHFLGQHLSDTGTNVISVPLRLSVGVGF